MLKDGTSSERTSVAFQFLMHLPVVEGGVVPTPTTTNVCLLIAAQYTASVMAAPAAARRPAAFQMHAVRLGSRRRLARSCFVAVFFFFLWKCETWVLGRAA